MFLKIFLQVKGLLADQLYNLLFRRKTVKLDSTNQILKILLLMTFSNTRQPIVCHSQQRTVASGCYQQADTLEMTIKIIVLKASNKHHRHNFHMVLFWSCKLMFWHYPLTLKVISVPVQVLQMQSVGSTDLKSSQ